MGLLNPAGIAWLVSVPALIWIYRRSRKKRRIEISSIIPWRVLKESVVRSSLFRADLLFWVQLAILLSLAAAACRPIASTSACSKADRSLRAAQTYGARSCPP